MTMRRIDLSMTPTQHVTLGILSDLHLEQGAYPHALPNADVLLIAGDVSTKGKSVRALQPVVQGRETIMVLGNHDYWDKSVGVVEHALAAEGEACSVHVLERQAVIVRGVRFLGATLWTDYRLNGDAPAAVYAAMAAAMDKQRGLRDHARCRAGASFGKFLPRTAAAIHASTLSWMRREVAMPFAGPTVILTHHAPIEGACTGTNRTDPCAPAYASPLDQMVADTNAALWVYGHTHEVMDTKRGTTRVISNPYGGAASVVQDFDPNCVVDLWW